MRKLVEAASGDGKVVVGTATNLTSNEPFTFFATNATGASSFDLGVQESEECSDAALDKAMIAKISEPRNITTNLLGAHGWHIQRVSQIEDSTLPFSLADYITGTESKDNLVAYLYSSEKNLMACSDLKTLDEDTAAVYDGLFESLHEEVREAHVAAGIWNDASPGSEEEVMGDTASGSKKGVFVVVSAIAAVGIAVMFGDILAL